MAGSQKITLWGPQRTPLGILRVKFKTSFHLKYATCLIKNETKKFTVKHGKLSKMYYNLWTMKQPLKTCNKDLQLLWASGTTPYKILNKVTKTILQSALPPPFHTPNKTYCCCTL